MPEGERFSRMQSAASVSSQARQPKAANSKPRVHASTYVRPGERKSGGVILVAGLLGAVALAVLVAAVIIHQNRKQPAEGESPPSAKPQEPADSPVGVPTQVPPQNGQQPVKDVAASKKAAWKRAASGPPAVLAALSPGTRTIQFRTPSAKPEYIAEQRPASPSRSRRLLKRSARSFRRTTVSRRTPLSSGSRMTELPASASG